MSFNHKQIKKFKRIVKKQRVEMFNAIRSEINTMKLWERLKLAARVIAKRF